MELTKLREPIPGEFISWKPKQIAEFGGEHYGLILPYKDARYDRKVLDEVCGPENWQSKMKMDENGVRCRVGIRVENDWVWREDYGDHDGGFEVTKSRASDAFKRACFQWGIGAVLYEFPRIRVQLNEPEWKTLNGKPVFTYSFRPNDWEWSVEYDKGKVKKVIGKQKFGNQLVERYNSSPYTK